jgi:predicted nucleotidyltransferase
MPDRETAYLTELVSRLRAVLDSELVGVYAGGSYALGDFEPSRSDLDVAVVTRGRTARHRRVEVVEAVRHESLPCPARGLELVLYRLAAVRSATIEAGFDLNLNTGRGMKLRVDFEPVEGERHWFAIDRSVLGDYGRVLFGPPAKTVFAPFPSGMLLAPLADVLRWYSRSAPGSPDAVLNACRALRYGTDSVWSSKPAAGAWALDWLEAPEIVTEALRARAEGGSLEPERVRAFLRPAIARLEALDGQRR